MSTPADRVAATDPLVSHPTEPVGVVSAASARLLDELTINVGVDEAVAALDRAESQEPFLVGGSDTPARRALLEWRRSELLNPPRWGTSLPAAGALGLAVVRVGRVGRWG